MIVIHNAYISFRPDSVKELYTSRAEVAVMVTNLDEQISTLETVKKGEVPIVAAVAVAPIVIQEPEIKTIEVSAITTVLNTSDY